MKVKSKHTNLIHVISEKTWKNLKKKGEASKYIVIDKPVKKQTKTYAENVRKGDDALAMDNIDEALQYYKAAREIKDTQAINERIKEIS